jgi:hypothetical protein
MSNFKNVLKVYSMMRAFDADDNAMLNTLRNATESELESLAEAIGPVKRAPKKSVRKAGKPSRAASIAGQIVGTAGGKCVAAILNGIGDNKAICYHLQTSPIHDPAAGYADYHEFQTGEQAQGAKAAGGE